VPIPFFYANKSLIRYIAIHFCLLLCERNTVLYQAIKNHTKWQQSHQYAAFDKMFLPQSKTVELRALRINWHCFPSDTPWTRPWGLY